MDNIKVGDFVIVNHSDRPCERLVAQVIGRRLKDGVYLAIYISSDPGLDYYFANPMELDQSATPLCDFGVQLFLSPLEPDAYYCDVMTESVAKYQDGTIRPWQNVDNGPHRARDLSAAVKAVVDQNVDWLTTKKNRLQQAVNILINVDNDLENAVDLPSEYSDYYIDEAVYEIEDLMSELDDMIWEMQDVHD